MKNLISIALWFDKEAEEAMTFYCSVFSNSFLNQSNPIITDASLSGVHFTGINGGPIFKINPSISMMVVCETKEEIDAVWNKLIEGGTHLMQLSSYPWSPYYGWLSDKYGVNWQLYLGQLSEVNHQKIIPTLMFSQEQFGKCSQALDYYARIFKDFKLQGVLKYTEEAKANYIQHTQFTANGFLFMAMDGDATQEHMFNEGVSFVISCDTQEDIDYYWNAFTSQGKESMCGWCKDAFGISWQIIPKKLGVLLNENPQAGEALMHMKKIIIADLM